MDVSSNTVVVTGFGPFRQHLVNSSWEATKFPQEAQPSRVSLPSHTHSIREIDIGRSFCGSLDLGYQGSLQKLFDLGLGHDVDLHIIELPVAYQKAKELVCRAWSTFQPQLMVHTGLASTSKRTIILEQCGKNKGYNEMDVCGFCPEDGCCFLEGLEKLESTINMKKVWKNVRVEGIDVIFSRDAGRYICDYTYYTSLYYGNGRAAFIHVPLLSKWVTAELLGRALQSIILEMLKQCKQGKI